MKKNYSFLSAIAAVAMALCVSFGFQSCGNLDNPLEEIVNNGGGDDEAVTKLMEALKADANIKVKYTVYGDETEYIATFKNVGSGEDSQYEIEGEIPEGLNYGLSYTLEYKELEGENFLIFTLLAEPNDEEGGNEEEMLAGTRIDDEPGEGEGDDDGPGPQPVMVVDFGIDDMDYDVYALPGFSFEVLSINNEEIKEIKDGFSKKATVNFVNTRYEEENEVLEPMYIGYDADDTWEDVQARYLLAGFPENLMPSFPTEVEGVESYNVNLWNYVFIYEPEVGPGHEPTIAYWFHLFDKDDEECTNVDDLAKGPYTGKADATPRVDAELRDIDNQTLWMSVGFMLPDQEEITWDNIVDENDNLEGENGIQYILGGNPNRIFKLYRVENLGTVDENYILVTTGDNYDSDVVYRLVENSQKFTIAGNENTVKLAIPQPSGETLTWADVLAVNSGDAFGNRISTNNDGNIIYQDGENTYMLYNGDTKLTTNSNVADDDIFKEVQLD